MCSEGVWRWERSVLALKNTVDEERLAVIG
jgi:hypothetical protein